MISLALLICAGALFIVKKTVARSVSTTIQVNSIDGGTGGPECRLRDAISAANTGAVVGGCDGSAGGPYILELIPLSQELAYEFTVIDNNANGLPIITLTSPSMVMVEQSNAPFRKQPQNSAFSRWPQLVHFT